MHVPKSYNFFDLLEPVWEYGPIWEKVCFDIFGLCGVVSTKTPLQPKDIVHYDGDLFVVPAHPQLKHSLIWTTNFHTGELIKCQAKLIDRVQWLLLTDQKDRLTQYYFPKANYGTH